jgi:hypothetical protein
MSQNKSTKTTTDVRFGKETCFFPRKIGTQSGERRVDSWQEVEDCLWDMFTDEDEFVTLTLAEIHHNIRYVQACQFQEGITVQLGVEEDDYTRLVEKTCSEAECMDIFREFYESSYVRDFEKYKPVEFFV